MTGHCLSRQRHHHHHCWSTEVHIWDIIGEVVKLCMYPAPRNPFAVDMDYFLSLSTHQQVLATAAMMVCLQKIVLHTSDDRRYAGKGGGTVLHLLDLDAH